MFLEEKISNKIEIIEYNGYNRPLIFDYILTNSTITKGLNNFKIKNAGLSLNIDNFKINSGTTTYSKAPDVTISGGGGDGAKAVAVLENKLVKAVQIVDPGSGYTSAPTIVFSGGTIETQGINPSGMGIFNKPSNYIEPPQTLQPYIYVWVEDKGAYLTQENDNDWLYLSDLTSFFTKIDKTYTIGPDGAFLVNQNNMINDDLNQIKELKNGKGYIIVNNSKTKLPYIWYEYSPNISSSTKAKITFDIEKCYIVNKHNTDFIDNNAKAIKLGEQRNGTCMIDYSATISVVLNINDLQRNTDYHIHLESFNKEVAFIEQDIYLDNNQLTNHSVYAKLKFLENNVNNIFDIQAVLNIGNNQIDRDILSIYVDCPPPPAPTPTPRPAQPIVRIVE